MKAPLVAKVGVENCAYSFDKLFSFFIPDALAASVCAGVRVLVPFGNGDRIRQGFVFSLEQSPPEPEIALKSVYSVLDAEPLLNAEMIGLALQLRERTFCTYFTAAKALLPGGMCLRTEKLYALSPAFDAEGAADETQRRIVSFLQGKKKPVRESVLKKNCSLETSSPLQSLEDAGVLCSETSAFGAVGEFSVRMVSLAQSAETDDEERKLTPKQKSVVDLLRENGAASVRELCYYTGVTPAVIRTLKKNGVCDIYEQPVFRNEAPDEETVPPPTLSAAQNKAYERLYDAYARQKGETALLFGVTGSGKTNVYLALIDRVLADGKNVVVLVPEISLTSQTISLFRRRFGSGIAVLHSGLSMGERRDAFYQIKNGGARVVIGTRSAIFAPLNDIGAVIIDEEQEHTYQSEMSPRYDARTVAKYRCACHRALLVLVSATPSVETYARAVSGGYILCELERRYGTAVLPDVVTVDMTDKQNVARYAAVSHPLAQALRKNLSEHRQSILLVNRRGYNTFVVCEECKNVVVCPRCSISLTYHSANHRLMCHYCGYSEPFTDTCPKCSHKNIRYAGFGTQRVEQELKNRFPEARILRMDADTTSAKNAHEKALSAFADGEYDILLGTQMVAKGLDFPNVTLVGVLSSDNELYNDDFRSAERTFDLLTQVTGRAGRGDSAGTAYIQTVSPENEILRLAASQDYKRFYKQEIAMRKAMVYPPFCDICRVGVSAQSEAQAFSAAQLFFEALLRANRESPSEQRLIVLGPIPPKVAKVNNLFRQKLIIKCVNNAALRALVSRVLKETAGAKEFRNVNIYAAMNPESGD